MMTGRRLRIEDYTVGWICALPIEQAAAAEMLDEEHQVLPQHPTDNNVYTFGRIGEHNVVIACLPAGQIGTNSAATVASQMKSRFTSIRFGLMVGIGGGIPSPESDIRLGDVVISQPYMQHGGVVQYDFGQTGAGGRFTRTGFLNSPPTLLLAALSKLRTNHIRRKVKLQEYLSPLGHLPDFARPGTDFDVLYKATYNHAGGTSCEKCSKEEVIARAPRENTNISLHFGTIASGNQIMKDAMTRDRLSSELGGVLCFEMEAAGLMNNFPCLVIRGICDYADSHKNKRWQSYAAATAAACTKELLNVIPACEGVSTRTAGEEVLSEVSESIRVSTVLAVEKLLPNKCPHSDTKRLDPALEDDRAKLYRRFRASLPKGPVNRDETHAWQALMVSDVIVQGFSTQGRWYIWLSNYLKEGHSVNIRDFDGKTPLHHALTAQKERENKVQSLVEAGADVTMQDFQGHTPVDVAKEQDTGLFIFLLRTWQQRVSE